MNREQIATLELIVSRVAGGKRFMEERYGAWEITDMHDKLLARTTDENEARLFEALTDDVLSELLEMAKAALDAEEKIENAGFSDLDELLEEQRSAVDRLADLGRTPA